MNLVRAILQLFTVALDLPTVRTATFNGAGFDTQDYEGSARIGVFMTLNSGTITMDGKIQHSDAVGSGYTDLTGATLAQLTASGAGSIDIDLDGCKRYIRFVGTIGGSSPNATIAESFTAAKKYR